MTDATCVMCMLERAQHFAKLWKVPAAVVVQIPKFTPTGLPLYAIMKLSREMNYVVAVWPDGTVKYPE